VIPGTGNGNADGERSALKIIETPQYDLLELEYQRSACSSFVLHSSTFFFQLSKWALSIDRVSSWPTV
jgi:hypothetical protein